MKKEAIISIFTGILMGVIFASGFYYVQYNDVNFSISEKINDIKIQIYKNTFKQNKLTQKEKRITQEEKNTILFEFNKSIVEKKKVLLGSATTYFHGSSPERIHNIRLGAQKVSNVIIQPGEIYSFLKHLGPVSEQTGYKKAYVISAGSTIKEAGGGVCQVSTTVFRAAIDAGLPIIDRRGHGYVVSYYGAGLDATIYGPYLDFKFLNDTAYPIEVKSHVKGSSVTFEIWGIPDGRKVTLSDIRIKNVVPPPAPVYIKDYSLEIGKSWCPEKPAKGMETEVDYIVTFPSGEKRQQTFRTKYKAWGKRCYIGAKVPGRGY